MHTAINSHIHTYIHTYIHKANKDMLCVSGGTNDKISPTEVIVIQQCITQKVTWPVKAVVTLALERVNTAEWANPAAQKSTQIVWRKNSTMQGANLCSLSPCPRRPCLPSPLQSIPRSSASDQIVNEYEKIWDELILYPTSWINVPGCRWPGYVSARSEVHKLIHT